MDWNLVKVGQHRSSMQPSWACRWKKSGTRELISFQFHQTVKLLYFKMKLLLFMLVEKEPNKSNSWPRSPNDQECPRISFWPINWDLTNRGLLDNAIWFVQKWPFAKNSFMLVFVISTRNTIHMIRTIVWSKDYLTNHLISTWRIQTSYIAKWSIITIQNGLLEKLNWPRFGLTRPTDFNNISSVIYIQFNFIFKMGPHFAEEDELNPDTVVNNKEFF